ncbi:tRNA (N(6)-L-threonylcarbamoyladenosine(37)-C(2))-methylthiotransferase MtaB [bacterium TMED181]|nr:tRNA (N(6)-L-threonylcarbamoyladenosine(37)-C(2))-methylthiotransferase MtaB [Planctomycetota bacterium]OUW45402.1 MAG: tRNA (N(6)-L-threonylcarbamoyladenosine(37)-C(2))-methylthiotransferase MtaB [bacterium TMED181]
MPDCAFVTFGCKINQYDTQAIREEILDLGYQEVDKAEGVDLVVVNSCTVTERAGLKVEERVKSLTKKNPNADVIVTGCISEDDRERLVEIPGVVHLIGNEEKHRVAEIVAGADPSEGLTKRKSRDIFGLKISGFEGRTRAFLKIQDGCDSFCSYCIIPYLRGGSRSRDHQPVLEEAGRLAEAGFSELVLTGIHLRQWGRDLGIDDGLGRLLTELRQISGIERIRLSSIGEGAFTDRFLQAFEEDEGLCRFFHVPLQSGSSKILEAMGRDYSLEEFREAMQRVRHRLPDATVATDLIIGFPGETEEDFQESMNLVEEFRFAKVHLFPYSPRPRTRAARLPDHVSPQVRHERMVRARQHCERIQKRVAEKRLGQQVKVLIEKVDSNGGGEGLSREGLRVQIPRSPVSRELISRGEELLVKLATVDGDRFHGESIVEESVHV